MAVINDYQVYIISQGGDEITCGIDTGVNFHNHVLGKNVHAGNKWIIIDSISSQLSNDLQKLWWEIPNLDSEMGSNVPGH